MRSIRHVTFFIRRMLTAEFLPLGLVLKDPIGRQQQQLARIQDGGHAHCQFCVVVRNNLLRSSWQESSWPRSSTSCSRPSAQWRNRYSVAKAKGGAAPPWPPTSSPPRRTLSIIQAGKRKW